VNAVGFFTASDRCMAGYVQMQDLWKTGKQDEASQKPRDEETAQLLPSGLPDKSEERERDR